MMHMMSRRAFILVIVLFLVGHPLLMTAAAEPIVIDRFSGDIDRATLMFSKSLVNSTLELEMPPGATIVSAEVTMEGLGGAAAESSILNFTNGKLDSNVFAVWTEARDLYPPKVDPRNNQWSKVSNREIPLIQKNDMNYWQIDTNDPKAGEPPGARAYQLYRFIPSTTGADNVTVRWEGFSTCGMNRTNPYHSEMWLYNHTDSDWIMVDFYDSQSMNDQWINYTFDLPSPFVDGDGSIDVLIVGINSQWAGPMLPAYDEGHLYTDYIELEVMSPGGLQYPSDVSMYIDLTEVTSLTGELRTTVTIDDSFGFPGALQAALDEHPVTPDNVTLSVSFAVGSPTAGRLLVSGLRIEYDPVVSN
ncbi:MAG: hypothetical protein GWN97_01140, partial [Thermoplasmata archaeon]|nr:hypothetical protein [Thermoplasmata archaeon]